MFTQKYSLEDLRQMKFGLLSVVDEVEPRVYNYEKSSKKMRMMKCTCDCGKTDVIVSLNNLIRHHTMSCGCYKARYSKQFLRNYSGDKVNKVS